MINRRNHKKKSGGSKERWLITYADLITLMLIFFIVMYTLSKVDVAKFETMAQSMEAVFGSGGMILESPGPSVIPGAPQQQTQQDIIEQIQLDKLKERLQEYIEENGLLTKVSVTMEERGIVLSFQDDVLFDLGSAQLTAQAQELMGKVAPILADSPNYVRIEGHTDNLPIHTARFPSNWELSAARATNVLQELIIEHGLEPQKLSATAYGEYRPRVSNDNASTQQLNRRVNMVILRSKFAGLEPQANSANSVPLPSDE